MLKRKREQKTVVLIAIVAAILFSSSGAAAVSSSDYVARWQMNEGGGQIVGDSQDDNIDGFRGWDKSGESSDPSWSTNRQEGSQSLLFDGNDDHVRVPHSSSLGVEETTVLAWVNPDTWIAEPVTKSVAPNVQIVTSPAIDPYTYIRSNADRTNHYKPI